MQNKFQKCYLKQTNLESELGSMLFILTKNKTFGYLSPAYQNLTQTHSSTMIFKVTTLRKGKKTQMNLEFCDRVIWCMYKPNTMCKCQGMPQGWENMAILYTLKHSPGIWAYKWVFGPSDMDIYTATADCPQ